MQGKTNTIQEFLAETVKDKNVLHVGCVDHMTARSDSEFWLHKHLARSARSIVGLDLLEPESQNMIDQGWEVVVGNAITVSLGRTFDVVVAGEIIEHVDAPGPFVANMARHINPGGCLVLTTPNPFFFYHVLEAIFRKPELCWNDEHVAWYEPFTLNNLLVRNGYTVKEFYYFTRSRKLRKMLNLLHIPCYNFLASSIVAIAVPAVHA